MVGFWPNSALEGQSYPEAARGQDGATQYDCIPCSSSEAGQQSEGRDGVDSSESAWARGNPATVI